jgi:serine/threonine protein kinase
MSDQSVQSDLSVETQQPVETEHFWQQGTLPVIKCGRGRLGKGSFGVVFVGTLTFKNKVGNNESIAVAIKVLHSTQKECFEHELNVNKLLTNDYTIFNDFIINMIYHTLNPNIMVLQLGFCNLYEYMTDNGNITFKETMRILDQLTEGLSFLQSRGVIHGDLKPENIIVSDPEATGVKITDFGSALTVHNQFRYGEILTSRWYRSPEIQFGSNAHYKLDVWALGCIAYELVTTKPLFKNRGVGEGELNHELIHKIVQLLGNPDLSTISDLRSGRGSLNRVDYYFKICNTTPSLCTMEDVDTGEVIIERSNSKSFEEEINKINPILLEFIYCCINWNIDQRYSARDLHNKYFKNQSQTPPQTPSDA